MREKGDITCNFTEADVEREEQEQKAWLECAGLKDEVRPVAGIPDDIIDKLEAVGGDDEEATRALRVELQQQLLNGVVPRLLRFALEEKDREAKKWAGVILASVGCSIGKYDKKLCEINAWYREEKDKIVREKQLVQVLIPKPIMEIVQLELRKAESYRRSLPYLIEDLGRTWVKSNLADYLPFIELPEFSMQSEPQWWKFLWPQIKKNYPDFLEKSRSGKFPTRGLRKDSRWASYRKEFRKALRTLARLRSGGVL
jgi:hypothetical protein